MSSCHNFCPAELLVKTGSISFPLLQDFFAFSGESRLDVLRIRFLFDSPLSTASLSIVYFAYFMFFYPQVLYLFLAFALAIFSGSRTPGILMPLLAFFVFLPRFTSQRKFLLPFKFITTFFVSGIFTLGVLNFVSPSIQVVLQRTFNFDFSISFAGRTTTTLDTFLRLLDSLPSSLFYGLPLGTWTSDSAIISIASKSGILAVLAFLFFLILNSTFLRISPYNYSLLCLLVFLASFSVGDMFVPSVTYLIFFVTFFIRRINSSRSFSLS